MVCIDISEGGVTQNEGRIPEVLLNMCIMERLTCNSDPPFHYSNIPGPRVEARPIDGFPSKKPTLYLLA